MAKPTPRGLLIVLGIVAVGAPMGLALDDAAGHHAPRLNVGEDQALRDSGWLR